MKLRDVIKAFNYCKPATERITCEGNVLSGGKVAYITGKKSVHCTGQESQDGHHGIQSFAYLGHK
jgi:hypothetical protein